MIEILLTAQRSKRSPMPAVTSPATHSTYPRVAILSQRTISHLSALIFRQAFSENLNPDRMPLEN